MWNEPKSLMIVSFYNTNLVSESPVYKGKFQSHLSELSKSQMIKHVQVWNHKSVSTALFYGAQKVAWGGGSGQKRKCYLDNYRDKTRSALRVDSTACGSWVWFTKAFAKSPAPQPHLFPCSHTPIKWGRSTSYQWWFKKVLRLLINDPITVFQIYHNKKIHDLARSLLCPVSPDTGELRLAEISLSCCLPCKDTVA